MKGICRQHKSIFTIKRFDYNKNICNYNKKWGSMLIIVHVFELSMLSGQNDYHDVNFTKKPLVIEEK